MNRTVEEYMAMPYAIEITPDDGSYFVKIKELEGCMSVGDTAAEALEMIEDAKRIWLIAAIQDGIDIPLPEALQVEKYSGKFALRLPKSLHRKLTESAEKDGISLNQYIVSLLSERSPLAEIKQLMASLKSSEIVIPEPETSITVTAKSKRVLPRYLQVVGG